MDMLIYNLVRGIAPKVNELDEALREEVLSNPYFMITDEGRLSFSPAACMTMTNHLYMEIKKLALYQTVTQIDQIAVTAQVLKMNEGIINQKIKDAIVNTLHEAGIDPFSLKYPVDDLADNPVNDDKKEEIDIGLENPNAETDETTVDIWNKIK
ncbi:MAG: hypothetical protein Q7J10_08905 [Methanosarcinaceae archaeon]|nr:hypothetical protein [Methanosarcinaceae archaeon]